MICKTETLCIAKIYIIIIFLNTILNIILTTIWLPYENNEYTVLIMFGLFVIMCIFLILNCIIGCNPSQIWMSRIVSILLLSILFIENTHYIIGLCVKLYGITNELPYYISISYIFVNIIITILGFIVIYPICSTCNRY